MLRRITIALGASLAFTVLAGCGGGNGHAAGAPVPVAVSTATPGSGGLASNATATRLTVSFHRSSGVGRLHPYAASTGRRVPKIAASNRKRSPNYVSSGVGGFQVAISAGGATTTAYYAASGSACTTDPNSAYLETCTYTLPNIGGTESIIVSETDTAPTTDGSGTATGFPADTNILAVGSTTAAITLGTTSNILVHVGEVVAEFNAANSACALVAGESFGESDVSVSGNPRLVFPSGAATHGFDVVGAADASGNYVSAGNAPATAFVDVDGTAKPITLASSSAALTTFPVPNPGKKYTGTVTYAQTATVPDSSYFYDQGEPFPEYDDLFACFALEFNYDGSPVANGSTFTVSNGLSAISPFLGHSYAATLQYSLSALAVYPTVTTIAMGGTGTVTADDYDAPGDLVPSKCTNSSGTVLATVASSADLSTTTWTEPFVITPSAVGTCTFTLADNDPNSFTATIPVTVTVTGS